MIRALVISLFLLPAATGCGSRDPSSSASGASRIDLSNLPVTVEGTLVADVSEGDVEDEDGDSEYSEFNFGTLTVGGEEIDVLVGGSVLRSAGLPEAQGRVRATIGSKSEDMGFVHYRITALERL